MSTFSPLFSLFFFSSFSFPGAPTDRSVPLFTVWVSFSLTSSSSVFSSYHRHCCHYYVFSFDLCPSSSLYLVLLRLLISFGIPPCFFFHLLVFLSSYFFLVSFTCCFVLPVSSLLPLASFSSVASSHFPVSAAATATLALS